MKFTGRYTAATAKALKGSPRLVCQVTEDGTIYVCNGFLLCTMNPPEYAATVQGRRRAAGPCPVHGPGEEGPRRLLLQRRRRFRRDL